MSVHLPPELVCDSVWPFRALTQDGFPPNAWHIQERSLVPVENTIKDSEQLVPMVLACTKLASCPGIQTTRREYTQELSPCSKVLCLGTKIADLVVKSIHIASDATAPQFFRYIAVDRNNACRRHDLLLFLVLSLQ